MGSRVHRVSHGPRALPAPYHYGPQFSRLQSVHHRRRPSGGFRDVGAVGENLVGRIIRAASSDREMASAIGVRVPTLFTRVFVFGTWLGAMGGGLAVPYVGLLTPGMGESVIIERLRGRRHRGAGQPEGGFFRGLDHRAAVRLRHAVSFPPLTCFSPLF